MPIIIQSVWVRHKKDNRRKIPNPNTQTPFPIKLRKFCSKILYPTKGVVKLFTLAWGLNQTNNIPTDGRSDTTVTSILIMKLLAHYYNPGSNRCENMLTEKNMVFTN